jgi:hypothetical protein
VGYSPCTGPRVILGTMEPNSAAEELPELYRAVLDRVGELEAAGHRRVANRIRADAIRIYSRAWDERAHRELLTLLRRNTADPSEAPEATRSPRRGTIRAA